MYTFATKITVKNHKNNKVMKQIKCIKKRKNFIHSIILCVLLEGSLFSHAQEGWHLLPFVPSQTLWDIRCVNKDTAVAVGENGYIIRTTNGGSHWDSVYSTTTNTLYKITFLNDTVGYVCGTNGTVLKTTNSGLTWTNIGISSSLNFLSMSFINQDTGWTVGGNGNYPYYLYGNRGILMKTFNGGGTWEIDTSINRTYNSVFFINKEIGFISQSFDTNSILIGNYAILYKTIDGGISWNILIQDTLLNEGYYTDIYFLNSKFGYLVSSAIPSENKGILQTIDSGKTWNIIFIQWSIRKLYIFDSCNIYFSFADMPGNGSYFVDLCKDIQYEVPYFYGMHLVNNEYGFCVGGGKCGEYNKFRYYIYKLGDYDAIKEIDKEETIKIIPNPCNDICTLIFNSSLNVKTFDIVVYNTLGQRINANIQVNDQEIQIDVSNQKSGVYIVSIKDKNKLIWNCKLIKL